MNNLKIKKCSKCKKIKNIEEFYIRKTKGEIKKIYKNKEKTYPINIGNLFSWCKECCKKHQKKYKEYKKEYGKKYRKENKEKIKKWRKNNEKSLKEYDADRYNKNPEKIKQKVRKRMLKLKNMLIKHTIEQWEDLKFIYDYKCFTCGRKEPEIKLTRDHITPISKGGNDSIENIIPLCISCNAKKSTKDIEWYNDILKKTKKNESLYLDYNLI